MPDDALLLSPLHERHRALGAKMAEFGGWSMPLEYSTGTVGEHTAVRNGVGLFDVSHLGTATVTGPGAAEHVNATLSNDLAKIAPGQAQYTLCCDDATGGVVDDMIVYLRGDAEVLLVPNAANAAEVLRRLADSAPEEVTVADLHTEYAVLAVQGPSSDEVLTAVGLSAGHAYMSFREEQLDGAEVVVCRSGYTGERGYELLTPSAAAGGLWDALLAAGERHGIAPCGLGARDTLRTEMGYPLHGQELTLDITPVQARSGWAVGWKKPSFWGREVLLAEREAGPSRRVWGLRAAGRGIPRPQMAVASVEGEPLGKVTSGTFSPSLRTGIGLALLSTRSDPAVAEGMQVLVDVRGRPQTFEVLKPPFVASSASEG